MPNISKTTSTAAAKTAAAGHAAPYFDTSKVTAKTLAGKPAQVFELTKPMNDTVSSLASAYGGQFGAAATLKPADLAAILKDKAAIGDLMAGAAGYLDEQGTLDERQLEPLTRGQLLSSIYDLNAKTASLKDWPQNSRDAFKKDLRGIVSSMLSDPNAKVYHLSGMAQDDWGTDIWMAADPASGRVKVFVQDGDM